MYPNESNFWETLKTNKRNNRKIFIRILLRCHLHIFSFSYGSMDLLPISPKIRKFNIFCVPQNGVRWLLQQPSHVSMSEGERFMCSNLHTISSYLSWLTIWKVLFLQIQCISNQNVGGNIREWICLLQDLVSSTLAIIRVSTRFGLFQVFINNFLPAAGGVTSRWVVTIFLFGPLAFYKPTLAFLPFTNLSTKGQ